MTHPDPFHAQSPEARVPGTAGSWDSTHDPSTAATQILRHDGDEPTGAPRDIGRLVGNDHHELFVSCGPAEAMLQQFDILQPEFIAIHDIGCAVSRRLLAGVAAASRRRMQKLVIRRQGYGTVLATVEFIEWPSPGGTPIRLYTTEIDADTASRHALAAALLAHSRLGVVIVGDLPAHVLSSALQPFRERMLRGPWPNRELTMLPLNAAGALAGQAVQLGVNGVSVRTTPQVTKPAQAWSFLSATWNRLREQMGPRGVPLPQLPNVVQTAPEAPAASAPVPVPAPAPLAMRPMPAVPRDGPRPARLEDMLADYVGRLIKLNGMHACCVFDTHTQASQAFAGSGFDAQQLAHQGHALLQAIRAAGDALGVAPGEADMALTLANHHLVLRALPRHPQLVLHAVLDRQGANLTLARLQIQRLDEDFTA